MKVSELIKELSKYTGDCEVSAVEDALWIDTVEEEKPVLWYIDLSD